MAAPMKFGTFLCGRGLKATSYVTRWMSSAASHTACGNGHVMTCSRTKHIYSTRNMRCDSQSKIRRNFFSLGGFTNHTSRDIRLFLGQGRSSESMTKNFRTFAPLQSDDYEWKDPKSEDEVVNVTYVLPDGEEVKIRGKVGDNAMYLAHRYNVPLEGACEASLACCTCHVYVDEDYFDLIQEALEDEEDMLDMAPFLQPNSRLGCQITLSKDMEGLVLRLPQATRNFYVDGHTPEPH